MDLTWEILKFEVKRSETLTGKERPDLRSGGEGRHLALVERTSLKVAAEVVSYRTVVAACVDRPIN